MSSVKCSGEFGYMKLPFVICNEVSIIENKNQSVITVLKLQEEMTSNIFSSSTAWLVIPFLKAPSYSPLRDVKIFQNLILCELQ